jgi:hypothetical protein
LLHIFTYVSYACTPVNNWFLYSFSLCIFTI